MSTFHVMVYRTAKVCATHKEASALMKKMTARDGELAMVVEMPEPREKVDEHRKCKTAKRPERAKGPRKRVHPARSRAGH